MLLLVVVFEDFVASGGRSLKAGLVAAYGPDVGMDAFAEAIAYGWEHWDRVGAMGNPAGYLYRVGQSAARAARNKHGFLPMPPAVRLPDVEPALIPALEGLSESQRVCVVLVHALGWSPTEVAEILDIHVSSVRTHVRRGLARLHDALEVRSNAG